MRSCAFICGSLFLLAGCTHQPEAYAPPAQIVLPSGPEPLVAVSSDPLVVAMSDPDASTRIIADVFPAEPGAEWRFTGPHPKFRLQLEHVSPLNFYMRFDNSIESVRDWGPVSFSITINGNSFRSQRFSSGAQEYRRPVPDSWITKPGPVDIAVDIEPPRRAPNGTPYGIQLHSIGFEER